MKDNPACKCPVLVRRDLCGNTPRKPSTSIRSAANSPYRRTPGTAESLRGSRFQAGIDRSAAGFRFSKATPALRWFAGWENVLTSDRYLRAAIDSLISASHRHRPYRENGFPAPPIQWRCPPFLPRSVYPAEAMILRKNHWGFSCSYPRSCPYRPE